MSRVLELKSKYGSFDASTLNHAQKVELRNELKSFKAGELGGVEEHRAYIELLKRTAIYSNAKNRVWKKLIRY